MLRQLKEVQADDSVVGLYQATSLGAFFNQSLVDTQAIYQERLRHGGIVVVHGQFTIFFPIAEVMTIANRSFANSAGKRVLPRFSLNPCLLGCTQEIQL